jgi:restriction system protein
LTEVKAKGPEFIRFFKPILQILKQSGGSGTTSEVIDRAVELLRIPESEQEVTLRNGQSRIRNQVQWARLYLVRSGYLESSGRGVWSLTEKGTQADLARFDPYEVFQLVQKAFREEKKKKRSQEPFIDERDESAAETTDYKSELLALIKSLPPNGFERLCQRVLRESGFQEVVVTGRSGDGGIDGMGVLQVNPFVSFNVLFQCKRYQGSVTPSQVRDFRGAMAGRADKGIMMTTGTFTVEAKKEARRDGAAPIELVAGEDLVKLFENLELGLLPKKTFEIDRKFLRRIQSRRLGRISCVGGSCASNLNSEYTFD